MALSVVGRLFQARMWREYAQAWDGKRTSTGVGREWVQSILPISRGQCLRRAKINVYLARRIRRRLSQNGESQFTTKGRQDG